MGGGEHNIIIDDMMYKYIETAPSLNIITVWVNLLIQHIYFSILHHIRGIYFHLYINISIHSYIQYLARSLIEPISLVASWQLCLDPLLWHIWGEPAKNRVNFFIINAITGVHENLVVNPDVCYRDIQNNSLGFDKFCRQSSILRSAIFIICKASKKLLKCFCYSIYQKFVNVIKR